MKLLVSYERVIKSCSIDCGWVGHLIRMGENDAVFRSNIDDDEWPPLYDVTKSNAMTILESIHW